MSDTAAAEVSSTPKSRSPNYPSMPLPAAIERVRLVYAESHEHVIPATVAIKATGYSERSSGGVQCLATLIAFGLLENLGRGDDRKVKVTFEALLIMNEPDSARGVKALQEAAKRPAAHVLLWDKFGNRLPGDSVMRSFLIVDQKFVPDGADQLIREYRETFTFARLDLSPPGVENSSAKVNDGSSPGHQTNIPTTTITSTTTTIHPKTAHVTLNALDIKQDQFAVCGGSVLVQWPAGMAAEDISDLEAYWPILLRKIKRSLSPTAAAPASPPNELISE